MKFFAISTFMLIILYINIIESAPAHNYDEHYDGEQIEDYDNNDANGKFFHHHKHEKVDNSGGNINGLLGGLGYGGIGNGLLGGLGYGSSGIGSGLLGGLGLGGGGGGGGLYDTYGYQDYSLTNIVGGLVNELFATVPRFATDLFGGKNYDQKFVADGFFGPGYNKKGGGIVGGLINSLLTATFDL